MNGIVLRWGVPALVTVVGGTSLAISATSADINSDLTARSTQVLAADGVDWASVSFDGRDAIVTGTATEQGTIDDAVAKVAAVHGVRSVSSNVVLAEFVSPFPFAASIKNGVVTLTGGVPDETAHAAVALQTASADDQLRILSGAPPRAAWDAAIRYGLDHLSDFDEGTFTLDDLKISITGRAKSPEAFDDLAILSTQPLPEGAELVSRTITPALAAPFEWKAEFDGAAIRVSGFTPSEAFATELRDASFDGWPIATSLVLASGAPPNFEATALSLLQNLVRLEHGSADISDGTATLTGSPADEATAEAVRLAMTPSGIAVDLEPPRVDAYQFTATRTDAGIVLSGYVPDAPTRDRLDELQDVDASGLGLARGAPERFDSAVEFGLEILGHLSEGTFTLRDTAVSVEGRATTVADFNTVETTLALGAPQGLLLGDTDVRPPLASPFTWSAKKTGDGHIRITGYVPSQAVRNALQEAATGLSEDASTLADGNPANFETEAVAALGVFPLLKSGAIEYDGSRWLMSGSVDTPEEGLAADHAFAATNLKAAGWSFSLDLPDAVAPVALPIIDPYVWRAQKTADGKVTLGGFVPTEALKKVLVGRAGEGAVDGTNLGSGYPENFIPGTLAAIDALAALDEGTANFDGKAWSLNGQVASANDRLSIEGTLQAAVDTTGWTIAIQALDAAPVVTPYRWAATKTPDGKVALSGYATTDEMREFIAVRAGTVSTDTTELASGEPAGFVADVLAGLEALNHLNTGTVKFEENAWTLAGTPQTQFDADQALAALTTATGAGAAWTKQLDAPVGPAPEPEVAVTEPETPAVTPEPVETAEVTEPGATPAPDATTTTTAPVIRNYAFLATKPLGGAVVLEGEVPTDAAKELLSVTAGGVPTDNTAVSFNLPRDFLVNAYPAVKLLASMDSGEFGLEGTTYYLTGRVETDAQKSEVEQQIASIPAAANWTTTITLLAPLDICRQRVAAFATRNAIIFQSGSTKLADDSLPAVDELAAYLKACPDAAVNVEGHTDADGDDDANLALSVARAEVVVEALIERGIAFQRLYAVGYGESLPVADNETNAGKKANRRIAFSFLDDSQ